LPKLKPEERFTLVEGLIESIDEQDEKLDEHGLRKQRRD